MPPSSRSILLADERVRIGEALAAIVARKNDERVLARADLVERRPAPARYLRPSRESFPDKFSLSRRRDARSCSRSSSTRPRLRAFPMASAARCSAVRAGTASQTIGVSRNRSPGRSIDRSGSLSVDLSSSPSQRSCPPKPACVKKVDGSACDVRKTRRIRS